MRSIIISFFILILGFATYGQEKITVSGQVIDQVHQEPVPFPTIRTVDGQYIGLGNSNGHFMVKVAPQTESLIFSCIGFNPIKYLIKDQNHDSLLVLMQPSITVLPELTIQPAKLIIKTIGVENVKPNSSLVSFGKMNYSAVAVRYKLKNLPANLQEVNIHIGQVKTNNYKLRLRVTSVKKGRPYKDLLSKNVIIEANQPGWINFPLEGEDLWVDEKKIFIIVEVLQDFNEKQPLTSFQGANTPGISYSDGTKTSYVATSPNNWNASKKTLAINLKVGYLP